MSLLAHDSIETAGPRRRPTPLTRHVVGLVRQLLTERDTVNIHEAKTHLSRLLKRAVKGELLFSAVSLWEVSIKNALGRADFRVEPRVLLRGLLDNGYVELPVTSRHAVNIDALPPLHKDLFDRLLLAQALSEGITLVTTDAQMAGYPGSVRQV